MSKRASISSAPSTPTGASAFTPVQPLRRSGRNTAAALQEYGRAIASKVEAGVRLEEEEMALLRQCAQNKDEHRCINAIDYDELPGLTEYEVTYGKSIEALEAAAKNPKTKGDDLRAQAILVSEDARQLLLQVSAQRVQEKQSAQVRAKNIEANIRAITRQRQDFAFEEGTPEFELHVLTKMKETHDKELTAATALLEQRRAAVEASNSGIATAEQEIAKAAAAEEAAAAEAEAKEAAAASADADAKIGVQTRRMAEAAAAAAAEQAAKEAAEQEIADANAAKEAAIAAAAAAEQAAKEAAAAAAAEKAAKEAAEQEIADAKEAAEQELADAKEAAEQEIADANAAKEAAEQELADANAARPKKKGTKRKVADMTEAEREAWEEEKERKKVAKERKEQAKADAKEQERETIAAEAREGQVALLEMHQKLNAELATTLHIRKQQIEGMEKMHRVESEALKRETEKVTHLKFLLLKHAGMTEEQIDAAVEKLAATSEV